MTFRIDLTTLQLFTAVVDEQSIARAAEKRNIAVSAVSRRISELEASLQVELLHRHSKGIQPTAAGLALLDHARIVIANLVQLETELHDYRDGSRGLIRLFANKSAILESLASDLGDFLAAHPLVKIDIEERISPDIVQAVAESRADIGVFGGNIPAPELKTFRYRDDRLVAAVAPDHPLARAGSLRFAEMLAHEFVSLERGSSIETLCMRGAEELGLPLRVRIRVSGFDALLRLIEVGMGVGVVPEEIAATRVAEHRIATVALRESWARRPLLVGTRQSSSPSAAASLLLEHLRTAARRTDPTSAADPPVIADIPRP